MLERDGFIERKIQNTSPIRVDYSLTSLGQNVASMAFQLKEWAETNIEQVLAAQMTYDEKSARASLNKNKATKGLIFI